MQSIRSLFESKKEPFQLANQKIANVFKKAGLNPGKYPLIQEILGDLLGVKVALGAFEKIPEGHSSVTEVERTNSFCIMYQTTNEKTRKFEETLRTQFLPNLHSCLIRTANGRIFCGRRYVSLLDLESLENKLLPAIENHLAKPEVLHRYQNCIENSQDFDYVVKRLGDIFKEKQISVWKTNCLEDTLCRLAEVKGISDDAHTIKNDVNPYSVDFRFDLEMKDAELIKAYFNNVQPGCATIEAIDHSDERNYQKIKLELTVDSAVLLSEWFQADLKRKLHSYDDNLLTEYQKQSGHMNKPAPTDSDWLPSASTVVKVASAATALGVFAYKALHNPTAVKSTSFRP